MATGAGAALRSAGFALAMPRLMTGDRVLFVDLGGTAGRLNIWEIRLAPGPWRVQGVPHQLTFGTLNEVPFSISATGTVALTVGSIVNDFYLIPLSTATGQPTGVARRLTQDGRLKFFLRELGGDPGGAYFGVPAQNYFGWLLTTFLVYWIAGFLWRRPSRRSGVTRIFASLPVIVYAFFAVRYIASSRIHALQVVAVFSMGLPALVALIRVCAWEGRRTGR